jgi:hypothetical protein
MRGRLAVLAVIAVALAAPAEARAADRFWLSVDPVRLADGWKLSAAVTSPALDPRTAYEILSVKLAKDLSARANELHVLNVHNLDATMVFDGELGRWRTAGRAGRALAIDMEIRSTSEPQRIPVGEGLPFGCRGSFLRRLVNLHGKFVLRTGTTRFGTIRRVHLTGRITYDDGGPVDCGPRPPTGCVSSAYVAASAPTGNSLAVDPTERRLVVVFRDHGWDHVMAVSKVSLSAAEPPTIRIRMPASGPVTGSSTFTAREIKESVEGSCRVVTAQGLFTGQIRIRYTGWGARTFGGPLSATYQRTGSP